MGFEKGEVKVEQGLETHSAQGKVSMNFKNTVREASSSERSQGNFGLHPLLENHPMTKKEAT